MNEELPTIRLDLAGQEFLATPLNAELFTFMGRTVLNTGDVIENSSRNHVFLKTGDSRMNEHGNEVMNGTYIFKPETVQILGASMLHNGFPATLHQRRITESDEAAYQLYLSKQITDDEVEDFFPDEWSKE